MNLSSQTVNKLNSTMKKPRRGGAMHPSPLTIADHLSFLPDAILTLAATLSPEDREVLAYLISFSAPHDNISRTISSSETTVVRRKIGDDHPPSFYCHCFRCYMSYWVQWDSSPNCLLMHEIIDTFEDMLLPQRKNKD